MTATTRGAAAVRERISERNRVHGESYNETAGSQSLTAHDGLLTRCFLDPDDSRFADGFHLPQLVQHDVRNRRAVSSTMTTPTARSPSRPSAKLAMLTPWRPRIVPTSPMTPGWSVLQMHDHRSLERRLHGDAVDERQPRRRPLEHARPRPSACSPPVSSLTEIRFV